MLVFSSALAAQAVPTIAYAYPAGAERGKETQIIVAGQNLKGCKTAIVGGIGVTAKIKQYQGGAGPLDQKGMDALNAYIQSRIAYLKNNQLPVPDIPILPIVPNLLYLGKKSEAELRALYSIYIDNANKPKAPMSEQVFITLKIDKNAAEGDRELRLVTPRGITNPLVFQIGHLGEIRENGPWEIPETGRKNVAALPVVLNGEIMPGQTDTWDVPMKKGDSVLAVCQARNLIPYLADAVPGWFQATLSILNDKGKELAWSDDNGWDPDPVVAFTAPADGVYSFAIRDAIYRGRYDFVYRLIIGSESDVIAQLPNPSLVGVPLPDPNAAPSSAQQVSTVSAASSPSSQSSVSKPSLPATISLGQSASGVILASGEVDSFRLTAKAGDKLKFSVLARMAGSALDATLTLRDSTGAIIAFNDDFEDKAFGVYTHHADPLIVVTIPATGTYTMSVADASALAGPDRFYMLNLQAPEPDFTVISQASAVRVRPGSTAGIVMQVVRRDNFTGTVDIFLSGGPKGFSAKTVTIPAGQDTATIYVAASVLAASGPSELSFSGRAVLDTGIRFHPVLPADLRMEAFGNTHLVQADTLRVLVMKKGTK